MEFRSFNVLDVGRGGSRSRRWLALATAVVAVAINAVPQPARAVESSSQGLARFYEQPVTWTACEGLDASLRCATLTVPLDYQAPDSATITITMSRLAASDPDHRAGVLLLNPGGPGGSGLDLPLMFTDRPLAKTYDLIGFDPRGFGKSTPVACEVASTATPMNSRPSDAEFAAWTASARADEEGCERTGKGLRQYVNTPNTARDMDVIRAVLGEEKINYLGFSYGTYLGAVYGSLFPARLNRSVLDSAVNPNGIWRESFKAGAPAARDNIEAWAAWVGQRNRTFGLGKSAAEVFAGSEKVAAFLHKHPVKIPLVDVTLLDRTAYDQLIAEWTRDRQLWSVAATIVRVLRVLATGSITADSPQMVEVGAAIRRLESLGLATTETPMGFYSNVVCEADWPTDLETYYADMRLFRDRYPFGWGVAVAAPTMCAFRSFTPPDPVTELSRRFPVGLVVQGEADTNTPYAGGPAMADALNEPLITVTDEGRHGQYLYSTCVQDLVDRYLIGGEVPARRVSCPGAPRPDVAADSATKASGLASLGGQIDELARRSVTPRALPR